MALQRLLAAGLLSAVLLPPAAAEESDVQSLVQVGVKESIHAASHVVAAWQKRFQQQKEPELDCVATPKLCQAPMMCQEPKTDMSKPFVRDGRPNYHSWCSLPYAKAAAECAAGNLSGYATLIHEAQLAMGSGLKVGGGFVSKGIENIDANYCFTWGHCDNTVVTASTTLDEMVATCDKTFGRESWEKITGNDVMAGMRPKAMGGEMVFEKGLKNPHLTHAGQVNFARLSCAQGNFHCDTFYCRQEYCGKEKWEQKFGHLKPKATEV